MTSVGTGEAVRRCIGAVPGVAPGPGLEDPVAALDPLPVAVAGSVTTEMVSWPVSLIASSARRPLPDPTAMPLLPPLPVMRITGCVAVSAAEHSIVGVGQTCPTVVW